MKTALLIIDVQNDLIKENPYNCNLFIQNLKKLLHIAREKSVPIVYVRHNDGYGELQPGKEGFEIYGEIAPINELIIDKNKNSAFLNTPLNDVLKRNEVDTLIITGMQTEYCIDASCKSAFEHNYRIIIPQDTNTTFDNEYMTGKATYEFFNFKIWNKRFADVLEIDSVIEMLAKD